MKTLNVRTLLPIAALLCLAAANPARAQAPLEPAQMSPRTLFYLVWHGVPGAEARKTNSLLALWDAADFAPVRSALAAGILNSSAEKSTAAKLTPEQLQEFAGLLENSFTLGYVSEPVRRKLSNGAVSAEARTPAWNGMFFVYDRTGKEMVLAKAILLLRMQEKEAPQLSQVNIGGVQVLKTESKNGATFWAEHGKYAVSAGERTVMEDILGRLDGKISGAASLAQSAAYQEAKGNLGGGLLEFFLRVPDLKNLAADSKAGAMQVGPLLEAAKLDAVHSVSGHITFEGAKTHVQGAILGNTAPGTPFDIWSAGKASPASLSFVPADAISYTSMQVNFFGIRKKPETLKLMRTVFSDQITSERSEGDVTFVKISLGGKQGTAGVAQWNFFNLAVTPDMILGSSRVETLREVLANRANTPTAAGLASVPQFQARRAQFPENLSGLSYFDFQKVDWPAVKDRWIEEAKKSSVAKTVNSSKDGVPSTVPDWLAQMNLQVVARHLHYSSSVSWKDAKGIHWDQWVE